LSITQDKLKEYLAYDSCTGVFTWLKPKARRIKVGSVAGSPVVRGGYLSIMLDGINYPCHQLAWLYVYGYIPNEIVDHRNNQPTDNRINNLRLATKTNNAYNTKLSKRSTTGIKGVHIRNGKYIARVTANGVSHFLGSYTSIDAATNAVRSARERLHGEYANHG
jgi:hypothetical protein